MLALWFEPKQLILCLDSEFNLSRLIIALGIGIYDVPCRKSSRREAAFFLRSRPSIHIILSLPRGEQKRQETGISKSYFVELPKDVQERFHYAAGTPIATQRELEPIKARPKQDDSPKADRAAEQGRFQFRLFS